VDVKALYFVFVCYLVVVGLAPAKAWPHPYSHDETKINPTLQFKHPIELSSNRFPIELTAHDEKGQPVPAFLAIKYADSWQWLALKQPFLPNPRSVAQRSYRPQWKTKFPIHIDGQVLIELPKGRYVAYLGKGLEYVPIKHTFEVTGEGTVSLDLKLERYIDMPAKGWWSGDAHVHADRDESHKNRELLLAAQAEDIHISSILLMGDQENLHFPQYAQGKAGTKQKGEYWLVPGQEEPRTSELGHTIILNTERLYRDVNSYYRYDRLFKDARRDHALTGIAHFFNDKFMSRNAGALLLAEQLVDFVEILDDSGMFKPEHYYAALNMGARLSLTAGSDYPWGAHIGDNRTYAQLTPGETLTPTKWYDAVKQGRTFVTQGPLLEFQVNGQQIGSDLHLQKGDAVQIHVKAEGYPGVGSPKKLWLVSQGKTLHELETEKRDAGVLEFSLTTTAEKSQWLAVASEAYNGAVAHSSPIYVHVDGDPILAEPAELLGLYEQSLLRIERLDEGEFVPASQRDEFLDWVERIKSIYIDKIIVLRNQEKAGMKKSAK